MRLVALCLALLLPGCSSLIPRKMPSELPPLADMDEPLALTPEPKDEAERVKLPLGGFTGIYVADARRTLDELEEDASAVRVARVIENSPGDAAGVEEGDLLVEATDASGARHVLAHPSEWRQIELAARPGSKIHLKIDRAGAATAVDVGVVARVRVPERHETARLREETRVGIVLRTATEVEARGAGLGPGGGAVVVGLSAGSPWRAAGLRFGDLITSVGGQPVAHAQVVLDAIRAAEEDGTLVVEFVRDGTKQTIEPPVSKRASEVAHFSIPFVFSYDFERGKTEWSAVIGLIDYESTPAAWQLRLLWFVKLGGGDADRLVEVTP